MLSQLTIATAILLIALGSFGTIIVLHSIGKEDSMEDTLVVRLNEYITNFVDQALVGNEQLSQTDLSMYRDIRYIRDKIRMVTKYANKFITMYVCLFPALAGTTILLFTSIYDSYENTMMQYLSVFVFIGFMSTIAVIAVAVFIVDMIKKGDKTVQLVKTAETILDAYIKTPVKSSNDLHNLRVETKYDAVCKDIVEHASFFANECRSIQKFSMVMWVVLTVIAFCAALV